MIFAIFILLILGCDANNLCQIRIYLSDNTPTISKQYLTSDQVIKTNEIHTDTYYYAVCITNENIRSRNIFKLTWRETNDENDPDLNEHQSLVISNVTHRTDEYSYLIGGFLINSNNLKSNYHLFCRFLTVNPSVYCEKEINLVVLPFSSYRFKVFLVILVILILIGVTNIFARIYLSRKKKSSINKNEQKINDYFRFISLNKCRSKCKEKKEQIEITIPVTPELYENIEMPASTQSPLQSNVLPPEKLII